MNKYRFGCLNLAARASIVVPWVWFLMWSHDEDHRNYGDSSDGNTTEIWLIQDLLIIERKKSLELTLRGSHECSFSSLFSWPCYTRADVQSSPTLPDCFTDSNQSVAKFARDPDGKYIYILTGIWTLNFLVDHEQANC